MLMNDKIIFDRCYCERNKVQKQKKYGALYITASSHIHTRKSFRFYARSGRTSVSHY